MTLTRWLNARIGIYNIQNMVLNTSILPVIFQIVLVNWCRRLKRANISWILANSYTKQIHLSLWNLWALTISSNPKLLRGLLVMCAFRLDWRNLDFKCWVCKWLIKKTKSNNVFSFLSNLLINIVFIELFVVSEFF